MTTGMYFALVAMVFAAPHVSRKLAGVMWAFGMVFAGIFWGKP